MKFPKRGYLVVASKKPNFYLYAINLIESIKDYYPDAHVTLVADEVFLDGREDVVLKQMLLVIKQQQKLKQHMSQT